MIPSYHRSCDSRIKQYASKYPIFLLFFIFVNSFVSSVTAMATLEKKHFVGFDLGTSGARISIIEDNSPKESNTPEYNEVHDDSIQYSFAYIVVAQDHTRCAPVLPARKLQNL